MFSLVTLLLTLGADFPHVRSFSINVLPSVWLNDCPKYLIATSKCCSCGALLTPLPRKKDLLLQLRSSKTPDEENSKSVGKIVRPKNEFSRTYRTETVLAHRRNSHSVSIKASKDELYSLAKRFKLAKILKLEAELTLSNDSARGMSRGKDQCIQVSGPVSATVTQTCVRTNEKFDEDVDFELFAAVRDVDTGVGLNDVRGRTVPNDRGGKGRRDKNVVSQKSLDEMGMKALQELLEDFDIEDDVIEDEAIFNNGVLDAGELVSQMFRLQLDPYPKKPGSEPVKLTFKL